MHNSLQVPSSGSADPRYHKLLTLKLVILTENNQHESTSKLSHAFTALARLDPERQEGVKAPFLRPADGTNAIRPPTSPTETV